MLSAIPLLGLSLVATVHAAPHQTGLQPRIVVPPSSRPPLLHTLDIKLDGADSETSSQLFGVLIQHRGKWYVKAGKESIDRATPYFHDEDPKTDTGKNLVPSNPDSPKKPFAITFQIGLNEKHPLIVEVAKKPKPVFSEGQVPASVGWQAYSTFRRAAQYTALDFYQDGKPVSWWVCPLKLGHDTVDVLYASPSAVNGKDKGGKDGCRKAHLSEADYYDPVAESKTSQPDKKNQPEWNPPATNQPETNPPGTNPPKKNPPVEHP